MPELSEDKRKQLDDIVGRMHANNESDENIQTLVNDFKTKNAAPESAISRFGTGLYNTTVGPLVNAVQHPLDTLGSIIGANKLGEAFSQAKQGQYAPAASSLMQAAQPGQRMASEMMEPIAQDIQSGNLAGAAGQATGIGASFLAPKALGALGDTKLGQAAGASVKAAAPDVLKGGLKAGIGGTIASHIPHGAYMMGYPMYKGLGQVTEGLQKGARAFGDAWKGPVEKPPEPPSVPTKGPSIGDLRSAARNGNITPEEFDAHIDTMNDLTPVAKDIHKANIRSDLQKAAEAKAKSEAVKPPKIQGSSLERKVEPPKKQVKPPKLQGSSLERVVEPPEKPTAKPPKLQGSSLERRVETEEPEKPTAKPPKLQGSSLERMKEPDKLKVKPPRLQGSSLERMKESEGEEETPAPKAKPLEIKAPETKSTQSPLKVETPKKAPEVEPRHEPYYDPDNPIKRAPISEKQIEDAQSMDRTAKEITLARHLVKNKVDLDKIPRSSEYLRAISKEAGLKREASLRTLENAIKKARELTQ